MLSLLYCMVLFSMGATIALLFHSPLRWVVVVSLDRLKRGRGRVVATTVVIVMVVVFCASLHHVMNLDRVELLNPALGVLAEYRLLETTLLGFCLFLTMVIDRTHSHIRELHMLRQKMDKPKPM